MTSRHHMNRQVKASFLVISVFLLGALGARAQNTNESATDFFNGGAQFYISNNIPDALKRVETGRKVFPEDIKLKKLEELLKQQQQQQQQQQQNQQQQQQQQQQNQQNQKNQQQKNQQKQSQQNQSQNQQQKDQEQQKSGQQQQNEQNQEKGQKEKEQAQQQQAMAMTPEEAKRMLDAQKGNEQVLQFKPPNQPENANQPVKDW